MIKVKTTVIMLLLLTTTACNKLWLCSKGFDFESKETPYGRLEVHIYELSDSWECNKDPGFYNIRVSLMDVPDHAEAKRIEMKCVLSRKKDESDIVFAGEWIGGRVTPKSNSKTWLVGSYNSVFLQFENYHLVVWCRIDSSEGKSDPFIIHEFDAIAHQTKRDPLANF